MSRSPTLAEVLRDSIASALEDVHTSIPGKVVRYDASKQLADVQPLVKLAYLDEVGDRVAASLPTVRSCPVQFPGGGGLTITFPVAEGDTGLLVFSEANLDKWLAGAGGEVDPDIDLRMGLSSAVFVPGVHPFGNPRDTPSGVVAVGQSGGSFQGAGLGEDIESFLSGWLTKYLTHTHVVSGPVPGNTDKPVIQLPLTVPTLASGTVKVTP